MCTKPDTSAHQRTRLDHASEIAEDYAEAIAAISLKTGLCRVTDLADFFGVSHVTVIKTIKRMNRDGYVNTQPYKPIELTPKGTQLAAVCKKRHSIVYRFLLAIGVDQATAMVDSEGIEHHVSEATLQRFKQFTESQSKKQDPN